ncbi:hypothetical protein D6817_00890 [Candidatus Pacearchaeota archaeon]|nr:MAG: hypothetical protein D6817_00890 [Candidatus Pacearchaeota archaeon]
MVLPKLVFERRGTRVAWAIVCVFSLLVVGSFLVSSKPALERAGNFSELSPNPGRPDLIISEIFAFANSSFDGNSTNSTNVTHVFMHVRTKNVGNAGVNVFTTTRVYLEGSATSYTIDLNVPPLKAGQSNLWAATLDFVLEPGEYALVAQADKGNAVSESNEANNFAIFNFSVS